MRLFRLNSNGRGTVFGPVEDEIMQIVWSSTTPLAVSQVHRALKRQKKDLAYSTVKAILTNLCTKGYLAKSPEGRANVFSAVITREAFQDRMINDVVNALSPDHRNPLLIKLLDRLAPDSRVLDALEQLIAHKRSESKQRG